MFMIVHKSLYKNSVVHKKFNHVHKLVNLVFVLDQAMLLFGILCTLTVLGKLLGSLECLC